jgi:hypothetical protein
MTVTEVTSERDEKVDDLYRDATEQVSSETGHADQKRQAKPEEPLPKVYRRSSVSISDQPQHVGQNTAQAPPQDHFRRGH